MILVRPPHAVDQSYPNRWVGSRLDVLATHGRVVNAVRAALSNGRTRVFVQLSPGSRIIGSAEVGAIVDGHDACSVTLTAWRALDLPPAGRSYAPSWYWVA